MHRPVITITPRESLSHLSRLLLETSHGGFPVVKYYEKTRHEVAYGLLTRCMCSSNECSMCLIMPCYAAEPAVGSVPAILIRNCGIPSVRVFFRCIINSFIAVVEERVVTRYKATSSHTLCSEINSLSDD